MVVMDLFGYCEHIVLPYHWLTIGITQYVGSCPIHFINYTFCRNRKLSLMILTTRPIGAAYLTNMVILTKTTCVITPKESDGKGLRTWKKMVQRFFLNRINPRSYDFSGAKSSNLTILVLANSTNT